MEFKRKFEWEDKGYWFKTDMVFEEIIINSKIYKILKEIKYFDRKWKPYSSAFLINNLDGHTGQFTAFLIVNEKGELETLISEDGKPDDKLMLEVQRKAISAATYCL